MDERDYSAERIERLLDPQSIAIAGASADETNAGTSRPNVW